MVWNDRQHNTLQRTVVCPRRNSATLDTDMNLFCLLVASSLMCLLQVSRSGERLLLMRQISQEHCWGLRQVNKVYFLLFAHLICRTLVSESEKFGQCFNAQPTWAQKTLDIHKCGLITYENSPHGFRRSFLRSELGLIQYSVFQGCLHINWGRVTVKQYDDQFQGF